MYVYVVDDRIHPFWQRSAERRPGPKCVIPVTAGWSMDWICRRILASGGNAIWILYLCAHGETFLNPSQVTLGQGLTVASAPSFELFRNHWAGLNPRIEVHSCAVASTTVLVCDLNPNYRRWHQVRDNWRGYGDDSQGIQRDRCTPGTPGAAVPGHQVMRALANAAGVLVIAGVDSQHPDARFQFEGPIRHYRPARYYRIRDLIGR